MMRILKTVLASYLVLVVAAVILVISGVYNVAATSPHWPLTMWVMDNARMRSIEKHAAGIETPMALGTPSNLAIGTSHYAAHCAVCHGAPGVSEDDYGKLVMASMMQGGHHHGGMEGMDMHEAEPGQDGKPSSVATPAAEADPHAH